MDEAVVSQLMDMDFPRNACIKGVHFSNNTGIEAAMNWVMEHMNDPGWFTYSSWFLQCCRRHFAYFMSVQCHLTVISFMSDIKCQC